MIPKVTRTDVKRFLETIRAIFTDKYFNIDDVFGRNFRNFAPK